MKKRCLLISPPGEFDIFPRGIMEIASFLNKQGCPASVLPLGHYYITLKKDFPLDLSHFILQEIDESILYSIVRDAIRESDPLVVGVSNCYTVDFHNCIRIVRMCKQINPRIITVLGGPHATFCDEESLRTPELDVVVRGEGEWIMLNLLRAVEEKGDFCEVRGITFRTKGGIQRNPPEPPGNLDEIPPVDFGLLPREFIKRSHIHSILNRGCAYNCMYCAEKIFWGRPRSYQVDKITHEMEILEKEYQTQILGLHESMADLRSDQFFELCDRIRKKGLKLTHRFFFTTRIDTITDDAIECLRKTNIRVLAVGLESFSPRVLSMMNKHQDLKTVRRGCEKLKRNGIWLHSYWMIGHPGDDAVEAEFTYTTFKELFERNMVQSGNVFMFVPYPGTVFFEHPEKYGIRISSYDWKDWGRWSKERLVSCLENFSKEEIVAAYEKARKMVDCYKAINKFLYFKLFNT